MVSEAKRLANARNAKKSTGPRTKEGKKRSAMNAMTHGLTARIAILPDEDPKAFEQRMASWKEIFQPRNDVELYHTESAVYFSWQLARARRALTARLYLKSLDSADDKHKAEVQKVAELAARLFRNESAGPAGGTQSGHEADQSVDPWIGPIFDEDHPASLMQELEDLASGCLWLQARWGQLGTLLKRGLAWEADERFQVVRLLGLHPFDADPDDLVPILQACHVLDPRAGDLASELSLGRLAAHAYHCQKRPAQPQSLADKVAARDTLLAIVSREHDRLEAVAEALKEQLELRSALVPDVVGVDLSPDGERMRRYETTCNKSMWRAIDEVNKRKGPVGYEMPRSAWLAGADETTDSSETTGLIDSFCPDEDDDIQEEIETPLRNEPTETLAEEDRGPEVESQTPAVCPPLLRNEPTEALATGVSENPQPEANAAVTPNVQQGRMAVVGQVLRNEPTAATFKGPHMAIGRLAIKGRSRKARRTQAAHERANGARTLDGALNLGEPRNLMRPIDLR